MSDDSREWGHERGCECDGCAEVAGDSHEGGVDVPGDGYAAVLSDDMPIIVTIPGEPHPQGRARATIIAGRARVYDPKKSSSWKIDAAWAMAAARRHERPPFEGPVALEVTFYFTCPKSDCRKRDPRPARWHSKRPDLDNLLKAVMDAAKGVLWLDDTQVAEVAMRKFIAAQGAAPETIINCRKIGG